MEESIPIDNDEISLPSDTLNILNEFLLEKAEREKREQELIDSNSGKDLNFEENWQLSQFWYNAETKVKITSVVKKLVTDPNLKVGLLSCPSLYLSIKAVHKNTKIFEFDKRFKVYGDDFVFYDFNDNLNSDNIVMFDNFFDILIIDPPFLSEECIDKISKIVKKLSKPNAKIIFCSGEIVDPWIRKHLNLEKCLFKPEHERNLGNEFVSYANFNLDKFL